VSTKEACVIFVASFLLTLVSSIVLSRRIEQLGKWLRLSESLLGIVAALGANAPEISSAISAMGAGRRDLGLEIVLGSNIFNLAALLGLSALLSGSVRVSRRTLLLNGSVAAAVMALAGGQLYGLLSGVWTMCLIAVIMVPYIVVTAVPPKQIWRAVSHLGFGASVGKTVADVNRDATTAEPPARPSYADILGVLPALFSIVIASIGMVHSAMVLGAAWKISTPIVGTIVLASLTGIPNVVTAAHLALRGRGSAVLSEALNSNTLNLVAGVSIPSLLLGTATLSSRSAFSLWWLVGMTVLALGLAFLPGGIGRKGGVLLIVSYGAFVVAVFVGR
jgi:cation:H+ antiporter